jgi:hypothetical protein
MLKIEISRSRLKPVIAAIGGSIFACAISVPALALSTAPMLTPASAHRSYVSTADYDHSAPLAGVQLAGGEGEYQSQPYYGNGEQPYYGGEEAEHERHEQLEQEGRSDLHRFGEHGEEYAQRLKNRAEQEHAEHEMRENNPNYNGEQENNPNYEGYAPDND